MSSTIFQNQSIQELLNLYQPIWALGYLSSISSWDGEAYMPSSGAKYRGVAMGKTQVLVQQLITDPKLKELLEKAKNEKLNNCESAVLRLLRREINVYEKLPKAFIEEFEQTVSSAQLIWRKAREENSFLLFQPELEKIVKLSQQKAKFLGYDGHPYNALLDLYEEDSNVEFLDEYFKSVIEVVDSLLGYISKSGKYDQPNPISHLPCDRSKQETLNMSILEYFKYDKTRLRLDISTHPFSEGMSTDDARITTRYDSTDFAKTLTSTIHEFGHALYFLQHNPEFNCTPLYTHYSLGVHESQSRFFENIVGRSKSFIEMNLDKFKILGHEYEKVTSEDYYRYFNYVKPGLIRVEADEVSYHTHIYIRYLIEKELIDGTLLVKDVPARWNDLYQKHLGIRPQDNATGCLQDIHWSMGSIGYFPTYSVGTVFASQLNHKLESDIGSVNKLLLTSDGIDRIKLWLKENVHQHGPVYKINELASRISGEKLTTKYWQDYLNEKYRAIY